MEHSQVEPSTPQYLVKFNPDVAYTLAYEDAKSRLIFVFEPGSGHKRVILHRIPLEDKRVVRTRDERIQARLKLALERTIAYLQSCGYEVDIFEN